MFKKTSSNTTFTLLMLMRTFTISGRSCFTEETVSFENTHFVGNDLIIHYNYIE